MMAIRGCIGSTASLQIDRTAWSNAVSVYEEKMENKFKSLKVLGIKNTVIYYTRVIPLHWFVHLSMIFH
jgi:hypothetical protein